MGRRSKFGLNAKSLEKETNELNSINMGNNREVEDSRRYSTFYSNGKTVLYACDTYLKVLNVNDLTKSNSGINLYGTFDIELGRHMEQYMLLVGALRSPVVFSCVKRYSKGIDIYDVIFPGRPFKIASIMCRNGIITKIFRDAVTTINIDSYKRLYDVNLLWYFVIDKNIDTKKYKYTRSSEMFGYNAMINRARATSNYKLDALIRALVGNEADNIRTEVKVEKGDNDISISIKGNTVNYKYTFTPVENGAELYNLESISLIQ